MESLENIVQNQSENHDKCASPSQMVSNGQENKENIEIIETKLNIKKDISDIEDGDTTNFDVDENICENVLVNGEQANNVVIWYAEEFKTE